MRSVFATGAALWFIYNAAFFIPDGIIVTASAAPNTLDGDASAFAVMSAARALFLGLAFVSLALVEWSRVTRPFRTWPEVHADS